MTLHPRLTRAAVALVKRFETFQPQAEPTPGNGWSIGYGHTRSARKGAQINESDAETLLIYDLDIAAHAVERALFAPVSQSQFEALIALCFNLGEPAFLRSSALARVNAGAGLDAADEIERWRRAELGAGAQVVDALVRRRAAEKAHFLGLPDGEATWPSAQIRPMAAPGGESEGPSVATQAPVSAALTAANGVQARLRRLIPEEATPARPAAALETRLLSDTASMSTAAETPPAPFKPLSTPAVAWEPTPPPFDPPAELPAAAHDPVIAARPEADAATTLAEAPVQARAEPTEPLDARTRALPTPHRFDPRLPYLAAGLLGVVLFVVAAAMILAGKPGLLDLGLGAAGVLLATPALYGLLGGTQRLGAPSAGHQGRDELSSDEPVAGAQAFPNDRPDTK